MEKIVEEKLTQFMYALDSYLSVNAEFLLEDVKIIYMTQWQEGKRKMFARGVVKIGESYFPVQLTYNINTDKLAIKSSAFLFYLNFKDIEDFLAQAEQAGDDE